MAGNDVRLSASQLIAFVRRYDDHKLTMGMLQYFTEHAFILPRIVDEGIRRPTRGRPCLNLYSAADLILIRWMVRLGKEGIPLKKFAGALKSLRGLLPRAMAEPANLKFFVLDKNREIGVSVDGSAFQLTGNIGQVLLAFSLDMARETIAGLEEEARAAS
jgi:hypothetical protein